MDRRRASASTFLRRERFLDNPLCADSSRKQHKGIYSKLPPISVSIKDKKGHIGMVGNNPILYKTPYYVCTICAEMVSICVSAVETITRHNIRYGIDELKKFQQ